MDPELLALVPLALVDSTSVGTLLLPAWFLLVPGRVQARRLLVFLGTIAGFYLLVGLALLAGAQALRDRAAELADSPALAVLQLLLGAALFVLAFVTGRGRDGDRRPGRVLRWRDRAMGAGEDGAGGGTGVLVGLALGAGLLEVATMLPYLAAVWLLSASDLGAVAQGGVLAGYCLVMVLPALVLLGLRLGAARWVQPLLARVGAWLERSGAETTAWVVGIVGFLLARDAVGRLPALTALVEGIGGGGGS
ncbi:Sap, sulfolipid-1-addressing protein [Geodermatophilus obscurus]|uniref:Sap, sulfolipid-1-addressing protein n=1 Tax=Geodermatophilus obscurus TaxID=1861 RepID=A0A1I5H660_9ACTN|nr:GAP family protein [Geodermatophilus obscurus]SFO43742.1 Sap, sulfolipid-1-addressing protein [Geodermatophilus obscurus]